MNRPATKTSSRFGCAGVLWLFAQLTTTLFLLGAAWWVDASWFDNLAWWRAPLVQEEEEWRVLEGEAARRVMDSWSEPDYFESDEYDQMGKEAYIQEPILLEFTRVESEYSPYNGGEITDPGNGATLKLPPGAMASAENMAMTMAADVPEWMRTSFAGPAYEIRIGGREHTRFDRPGELTLPYSPLLAPDGQVQLIVWEGGQWRPLPSRVDSNRNTVTAAIPHASYFSTLSMSRIAQIVGLSPMAITRAGLYVILAYLAIESETIRDGFFAAWYGRSYEYETPEGNYKIHYYKHGAAKIPTDWEMLQDPNVPEDTGRAPLYVRRLGHFLELIRGRLQQEGFHLPEARLIRHDVFLVLCGDNKDDFGESLLGGPLFISPRLMQLAKKENRDLDELIMGTITHELLHVSQGRYYGIISSELWYALEAFVEPATEYNTWRHWYEQGITLDYHNQAYIRRFSDLPATPLLKADGIKKYGYSVFFEWMHHKYGSDLARKFIVQMHRAGDGSLESLGRVTAELFPAQGHRSFVDLFVEFAANYYHFGLWNSEYFPTLYSGGNLLATTAGQDAFSLSGDKLSKDKFRMLVRQAKDGSVVRNAFNEARVKDIQPLAVRSVHVHTGAPTPPRRRFRSKLVIEAEGGSGELKCLVAAGQSGDPFGTLPSSGGPGALFAANRQSGRSQMVLDDIGLSGGPNLVTILLANTSTSSGASGIKVRRWLLEPPHHVELEQLDEEDVNGRPRQRLRWEGVDLVDHGNFLKAYNIYRRSSDQKKGEGQLIEILSESRYLGSNVIFDLPPEPDRDEYFYAVSAIDRNNNESDRIDADPVDPFVGTWDGEIVLLQGDFAEPIIQVIEDWRLSEEEQPDEPPPAFEMIYELMRALEILARIGLPVQFKIDREGDGYRLLLTEFIFQPLDLDEESYVPLDRKGRTKLMVRELREDLPPVFLSLHRMDPLGIKPNVIRQDQYMFEAEAGNSGKQRCFIRWQFTRRQPEEE